MNVATTLLGQVDAAVGGKTGVNLPEGKNLVGAFWQPRAVLCDTEVLATLPPREWASGRGEMAKYAFLGRLGRRGREPDASLLELPLDEQVARCVAIKAEVVAADEREGDRRMLLNYGHTLAHALEAAAFEPGRRAGTCATGRRWPSGWSSPACWPGGSGRIDDDRVELHRRVVGGFDLSAAAARTGPTPSDWSRSWPGTRRPTTTSPSCSTGPRGRGGARRRPGRRGRYPGGDGADRDRSGRA